MNDFLIESRIGAVSLLTINRPDRLNALSPEITDPLVEKVQALAADENVSVIVITGAGRAFSAGGDIKSLAGRTLQTAGERRALLRQRSALSQMLHEAPKITIAMVNGPAMGAGLSIALACDIRVAAESAQFATAFVNLGLSGDLGFAYFLQRAVGYSKALELLTLGEKFGARDALTLGMVNRVVPDDDLRRETLEMATRLAEGPQVALRAMKQSLREAGRREFSSWLDLEAELQAACQDTEDHAEAKGAFSEKRRPSFVGR